jgi:hypothetical protein
MQSCIAGEARRITANIAKLPELLGKGTIETALLSSKCERSISPL